MRPITPGRQADLDSPGHFATGPSETAFAGGGTGGAPTGDGELEDVGGPVTCTVTTLADLQAASMGEPGGTADIEAYAAPASTTEASMAAIAAAVAGVLGGAIGGSTERPDEHEVTPSVLDSVGLDLHAIMSVGTLSTGVSAVTEPGGGPSRRGSSPCSDACKECSPPATPPEPRALTQSSTEDAMGSSCRGCPDDDQVVSTDSGLSFVKPLPASLPTPRLSAVTGPASASPVLSGRESVSLGERLCAAPMGTSSLASSSSGPRIRGSRGGSVGGSLSSSLGRGAGACSPPTKGGRRSLVNVGAGPVSPHGSAALLPGVASMAPRSALASPRLPSSAAPPPLSTDYRMRSLSPPTGVEQPQLRSVSPLPGTNSGAHVAVHAAGMASGSLSARTTWGSAARLQAVSPPRSSPGPLFREARTSTALRSVPRGAWMNP